MGEKILIIDDDPTLLGLLRKSLEKAGYRVATAGNGIDGLQLLFTEQPDLVILDVMMPRMDGWETCARIREFSQVSIIMLTAKDQEADKIKGFQYGVDDYVTKPFSFAELVARVGARLHRSRQAPVEKPRVYIYNDLTVDLQNGKVTMKGKPVSLTPTEFRLLGTLAEHAGRTLSPEQILNLVWGPEYAGDTGYVKRYIWYLRQKLEDEPQNPKYIVTERGFGYRLGE